MNWATIAPETRLYKGKALFRWEVSPGLEHHCGICATPLHNGRAKTSCIGKHVEPCYRFHQQLHFVGKSHECFGCNSSDELHHSRHKEILKIVRQIAALDEPNTVFPPAKASSSRGRRGSSATNSNSTLTDTGSECPSVDDTRVTRREKKKAKKSGNGRRDRKSFEAFPLDETDFISEAIHLTVHESKGAWEGTYVYDYSGTAVDESPVIEENDAEYDEESMVARFESFAVKSPATPLRDMTPRQRKIVKRTSTPVKYASHGLGSRKYSTQFAAAATDAYDGVDPEIFFRLGIEVVSPPKNSRTRKDLVAKLVAAVKEDIEIITREDKETEMRAEGFWRWAGRNAYNTILQTRENLDWATGQKKGIRLPQFEHFDDEDMEEDDQAPGGQAEKEKPKPNLDKAIAETVLKAKIVDEDGFTIASSKKGSTKKVQGNSKKFTKLPLNYKLANHSLEIDEEEEGEDVVEMLRRYEQKKCGERNLGGIYDGSTPDRRPGRGKARTLIIK
ncbi:hypothetical protein ONS95_014515 [Cadophora gregata]|uniref:uncharacterized protein n=1 Tax=Cadophora gregata TaxID=51156 RepID=UPI0026DC52A6|nr:uncharacterized protein ONS95_014515 [Cadophora gregata]KAK0112782.1 hypothetical protein ONS95_014515 [Cadophora gregata]KAK0124965.1 hypothetical protein ONS96_008835 [Cadophora gregata f. sp. sojae]